MAKKKVTAVVEELARPIVEKEGLELVDVEYVKEGANWFLRVFIDRPEGGVDIEDCSRVSEQLSNRLDEVDPIPNSYFLEVSSPGIERPLKGREAFRRAVGKTVAVTTYEPIGGQKKFQGTLTAVGEDVITLEDGEKTWDIPLHVVASARSVFVP
ncbi:MAG: ribosome maturation factor RimP [Alicyclobacillaceae bacterium]|nr:ribosome maturation factor RimP [Alicyclobacillaceae bacterium]